MKKIVFVFTLAFLLSSFCLVKEKTKIIYLQPLGDIKKEYVDYLVKSIKQFYGYDCVIKSKSILTYDLLTRSKTRYDANKIVAKFNSNQNLLLITEKDIAYKKSEKYQEWGIFGLGLRPGKTCVISTFRLKNGVAKQKILSRLNKIALHEIGHNLGLEHCVNNSECMMNDANGTIKQVDREKVWFCSKCIRQIKTSNN